MVQVVVNEGVLEGEVLDNVLGGKYDSFKGIPYAKPPLGHLRFRAPQPPEAWKGVRNAKKHGPVCHQVDVFMKQIVNGSEDCLYLNVYSPNLDPKEPLPVMFWIHGGAFLCFSGNSDVYGPDFLLDHDVIVVTINYRLEVLGFLCLDTEEVPGNAGMKDQVAALKWVKNNIRQFGGDPENITIFGESAGGTCVAYHLISPMTKGLFKRAILQSGVNLSPWALIFEPRLRAEALALQLGKDIEHSSDLDDFFKTIQVEKLIGARTPITLQEYAATKIHINFGVVSEKQFENGERYFGGDILEAVNTQTHGGVEVMTGYTTHEGLIAFNMIENVMEKFNMFYQCFLPEPILKECVIEDQLKVGRKIKDFYVGQGKLCHDNVNGLVNYFTSHLVSFDTFRWAKIVSKRNPDKLYFYKFDAFSERNVYSEWLNVKDIRPGKPSVCHVDDLPYLFHHKAIAVDKTLKSYTMVDKITTLWTNFAKYGNPTPDDSLGIKWSPFDLNQQAYLHIGEVLTLESHPDSEEMKFREKIYRDYLPTKYHV